MNEQKRINIILIVLFALLIISIFIVALDPTKKSNQYVYNGFVISKFRLQSAPNIIFNDVELKVGDKKYTIPIRNNPKDLESIDVTGMNQVSWLENSDNKDNYDVAADNVYITFDPTVPDGGDLILAGGGIVRVLGSGQGGIYNKNVNGAFTFPINGSSTPVKTCNDANGNTGIIWLKLGNANRVYADGDCVIIEALTYPDLIKSSERFILELIGVMQS